MRWSHSQLKLCSFPTVFFFFCLISVWMVTTLTSLNLESHSAGSNLLSVSPCAFLLSDAAVFISEVRCGPVQRSPTSALNIFSHALPLQTNRISLNGNSYVVHHTSSSDPTCRAGKREKPVDLRPGDLGQTCSLLCAQSSWGWRIVWLSEESVSQFPICLCHWEQYPYYCHMMQSYSQPHPQPGPHWWSGWPCSLSWSQRTCQGFLRAGCYHYR